MNNENNVEKVEMTVKLEDKDIKRAYRRWVFQNELCDNYERYMAMNFCNAIAPALRKLYKNEDDFRNALKRHMSYFNVEAVFGSVILGSVLAMEEQKANGEDIADGAIVGLKSGLMGPLSGVGDTIVWGNFWTLCNALAAGFAIAGNVALAILFVAVVPVVLQAGGYFFTKLGYKQGKESVRNILSSGMMKELVSGASMLGLFMMGALSAGIVSLSTKIQFTASDTTFVLQDILDSIVPGILPLGVVFLVYYGLAKKKISPTVMILILIAVSLVGTLIGIV